MKRLLVSMFCLLLIIGGGAAWWYARDTPENVLRDGVLNLIDAKGVTQVQLDVATTNLQNGRTTGFTSVSQLDLTDVTRPQSQGILRIGSRGSADADQFIDLVVQQTKIFIRPRSVNAERRAYAAQLLAGASSTAFLSVDRDAFLQKFGYGAAVARGASSSTRDALRFLLPAIVPPEKMSVITEQGIPYATVQFRFDRKGLRPVLITVWRAWKKGDITVDEYAAIDRLTEELGRGIFTLTIHRSSRAPVKVVGEWPIISDNGMELQRVRMRLDLLNAGASVQVHTPTPAKDVTQQTVQDDRLVPLPSAGTRTTLPNEAVTSSDSFGAPAPTNIDVFQEYFEQLKRKKALY